MISHLRLAVHQREHRAEIAGDPGVSSALQGYAAHYCGVPRAVDPGIVACSMITSGLRVFDIRNPYQPREVAYYVTPPGTTLGSGAPGPRSNWAMSRPAFDIVKRQISTPTPTPASTPCRSPTTPGRSSAIGPLGRYSVLSAPTNEDHKKSR